jgi:hypothetical protein
MPVKRRIAKARKDYPKPWEERPVSRERWERHRERMMANCFAGRRPEEWWEYESPLPRDPDFDVPQCVQLYKMGELRADELAELLQEWRRHYERAQEPGFTYCLGQKNGRPEWLEGAAARKALYRWAGIPAEIVRKWNAEWARPTKTVRQISEDCNLRSGALPS